MKTLKFTGHPFWYPTQPLRMNIAKIKERAKTREIEHWLVRLLLQSHLRIKSKSVRQDIYISTQYGTNKNIEQ